MQNLEVVKIDWTRNLILVKGAVPGHKGSKVIVQFAVKHDYQGFEIKVHSSDAEQESKEIQNNETDADIKTETPAAEEAVTETPAAETSTKTTDTDGSKEPKKSD